MSNAIYEAVKKANVTVQKQLEKKFNANLKKQQLLSNPAESPSRLSQSPGRKSNLSGGSPKAKKTINVARYDKG